MKKLLINLAAFVVLYIGSLFSIVVFTLYRVATCPEPSVSYVTFGSETYPVNENVFCKSERLNYYLGSLFHTQTHLIIAVVILVLLVAINIIIYRRAKKKTSAL